MDFLTGKYKKVVILMLCIIAIILFFKYLFALCWPLIIALGIVSCFYDRLWRLEQKTGISRVFLITVFVIVGVVMMIAIAIGLLYAFSQICVTHIGNIMEIEDTCMCEIDEICKGISNICGIKFNDMINLIHKGLSQTGIRYTETVLPQILKRGISSFKVIASFIAVLMITGILIILLMREYGEWRNFIYQRDIFLPVCRILKRLKRLLKEYAKAELIIMLIISGVVGIGMSLIGVEHSVFIAFLTGFLDMLPFIGTGLVLFPIGLWLFLKAEYVSVVIVSIIYIICVIIRQYMEPKLIGHGTQVSAVGILIAIFMGIKLYGVIGVLFGPFTLMICIECYREIYKTI